MDLSPSKVAVALSFCLSATVMPVLAQECGDADGKNGVTVSDGVQVLRAAAELSSLCSIDVCDMDGNGTVTVTDGVSTLRKAAELPGVVEACPLAQPLGCPRYEQTCTPAPLGDTFAGPTVQATGGRACSNFADDTALNGITAGGFVDITVGARGSFGVNARDSDGEFLMFLVPKNANFVVDRSQIQLLDDGSIVIAREGDGAGALIGRAEAGPFEQAIRSVRYRVHVRRICGVGEPVIGDFQGTFQLPDGSFRDLAGQFSFFRTF